jgi:hypothetical protein
MPDFVGLAVGLAALGGVGFGPGLWMLAPGSRRMALALALSPALGLVIIGLVQRLLVEWVGPVRVWAGAVTVVLLIISVAAVVYHWRTWRDEFQVWLNWRDLVPLAAIIAVSYVVLAAPSIVKGIQYTIFRSNSSDALVYMSLAESLRTVDWQTLVRGAPFTLANLPNLATLAAISPTALFTARFVSPTSVITYPALIAWGSQITSIPIYRYYYIMALVCLGATIPAGWAIGHELKLPRPIGWAVGPAIGLGFWAHFVLERDAGYQISSIPALLLLVFAWIRLESEPLKWMSTTRILLALAITAILYFHTPVILVVALAFAVYYGLGLVQRVLPVRAIFYHATTAGLMLVTLAVSGQLRAVAVTSTGISTVVALLLTIEAEVIDLLRQDPIASFWGMPRPWLVWPLSGIFEQLARRLALLAGLAWFAALGIAVSAVALKRASRAERLVLSAAAAGLVVLALMWSLGNYRAADKGFTYVYPYLLLAAGCAANHLGPVRRVSLRPIATASLAGLMLSQVVIGAWLPFYQQAGGLFATSASSKPEEYDLRPILAYLDKHPPRLLLVNIPRARSWEFALYGMFVFDHYPAHFESGLVIDNNKTYRNLWFDSLQAAPDYAVVLREADYIAPGHLGTEVAHTRDLVLYQLNGANLTPHLAQESQEQEWESAKPLFPTLAQ